MRQKIEQIAGNYFAYLAQSFPVMCASDEFDFLPRAESASLYYHRLDNLDDKNIQEVIGAVKDFGSEIRTLKNEAISIEDKIDLEFLESNHFGVLIEFEHVKSWKHNPLLYLKVAFIGLDHALSKPCSGSEELVERFTGRLSGIPGLLRQGIRNLENIPKTYHGAALAMVDDASQYLAEASQNPAFDGSGDKSRYFEEAGRALDSFRNFLVSTGGVADTSMRTPVLEMRVNKHFSVRRSLEEIYEFAKHEWEEVLGRLERLSREIDPRRTWREIYKGYKPVGHNVVDTHTLYRDEIERLREHVRSTVCLGDFPDRSLELAETPTYIRSVRSSASFAAPFSSDPEEKAYFYITSTNFERNRQVHRDILKRLHREYRFLTAHETYPGHHLLDIFRKNITNPIRRQIESPLFYEGWAYYAESIPVETGYINDPVEILVDLKRQLWRSARCQIDVGLATGKLSKAGAVKLLRTASFSEDEAVAQVNRFGLNPGYQLCYSLGKFEIKELRKKHEPSLGFKKFHRALLEGGELPFHLADLNLERQGRKGAGKK